MNNQVSEITHKKKFSFKPEKMDSVHATRAYIYIYMQIGFNNIPVV